MAIILPANTLSAGGYDVDNSCRFNDGDSAYMHKTPGGAGNMKTWTWNAWIKRGTMSATQFIMEGYGGSSDETQVYISSGGAFAFYTIGTGMGDNKTISSTNLLRDPSAWYMLTVRVDTTDATANNRCRLYINGTEITYTNHDALTEDGDGAVNEAVIQYLGRRNAGDYFDGYMAEVCLVDGSSLAPTSFGEFNSDSPTIWQPIDVSGLSFGTNGYYLDFEDSSNLGNDANGGTDLTEVNLAATDQATDTPTNNFATLNPLVVINGSTFSEGNCKIVTGSSPYSYDVSTIAVTAGKWYVEALYGGDSDDATFGIAGRLATATTHELGQYDDTWSYYTGTSASNIRNNNSNSSYGATYTTNDIIGLALDLTNNKLYFSKNGAWQNSGDPTSGATGTGAVSITAASSVTDGVYYIGVGDFDGGASVTWEINFGNPSFAISSGNADANGYGNMEYAFPDTDYYCLNTANLAEFG